MRYKKNSKISMDLASDYITITKINTIFNNLLIIFFVNELNFSCSGINVVCSLNTSPETLILISETRKLL